jgi:hypothetical protein
MPLRAFFYHIFTLHLLILYFVMRKISIQLNFTLTAQPPTNMGYICYFLECATGDSGNSESSEGFNSVM